MIADLESRDKRTIQFKFWSLCDNSVYRTCVLPGMSSPHAPWQEHIPWRKDCSCRMITVHWVGDRSLDRSMFYNVHYWWADFELPLRYKVNLELSLVNTNVSRNYSKENEKCSTSSQKRNVQHTSTVEWGVKVNWIDVVSPGSTRRRALIKRKGPSTFNNVLRNYTKHEKAVLRFADLTWMGLEEMFCKRTVRESACPIDAEPKSIVVCP